MYVRKPSYRVGVWGRENAKIFSDPRLADCSKMVYIYIYIYTQNSIFGGSVLERFLDRFFNDFLISFYIVLKLLLKALKTSGSGSGAPWRCFFCDRGHQNQDF